MQTIAIQDPGADLAGLVRSALADGTVAASLAATGLAGPINQALAKFPQTPEPTPAAPCPYEAAARAAGYVQKGDLGGVIYHIDDFDSWKAAVSWGNEPGQPKIYDTWQECCQGEGIDVPA